MPRGVVGEHVVSRTGCLRLAQFGRSSSRVVHERLSGVVVVLVLPYVCRIVEVQVSGRFARGLDCVGICRQAQRRKKLEATKTTGAGYSRLGKVETVVLEILRRRQEK